MNNDKTCGIKQVVSLYGKNNGSGNDNRSQSLYQPERDKTHYIISLIRRDLEPATAEVIAFLVTGNPKQGGEQNG